MRVHQRQRHRWRSAASVALLISFAGLAGCGGSKPSAPEPDPGPSPINVTGTERIGWDQQLAAGTSTGDYSFAAYVDGVRHSLSADCNPAVTTGMYSCMAPLPPLTIGPHSLQLVSVRHRNGAALESDRSAPFELVRVASGAPGAGSFNRAADPLLRERGPASAAVELVGGPMGAIADIAAAPGGRLFIAERQGRVRVAEGGIVAQEPALVLADVVTSGGLGLFAIAVHPDFDRNRYVYLAYAAATRDGPVFRVARAREVEGGLGEVAVLVEERGAAAGGWSIVRFGPDRKLYVTFGVPRADLSRSASTVLRLEDDGSSPREDGAGFPVFAEPAGIVRGLAWREDGAGPFTSETGAGPGAPAVLRQLRAGNARSQGRAGRLVEWPAAGRPGNLAFQPRESETAPGRLLVAMLDGGVQEIRLSGTAAKPAVVRGSRIAREYGAVGAVTLAQDGSIYVGTANGEPGTAKDVLLRVKFRADR